MPLSRLDHRAHELLDEPGVGRAVGLHKLVFERRTRKLLGVHVLARGASDMIQPYAIALKLGATIDDVARSSRSASPSDAVAARIASNVTKS